MKRPSFDITVILLVLVLSQAIGWTLNVLVGLSYRGWFLAAADIAVINSLALGLAVLISLYLTRYLVGRSERTVLIPIFSSGLVLGAGIIAFIGFFWSRPTSFLYADNRLVNYLLVSLLFFIAVNVIVNGLYVFQHRMLEKERALSQQKRLKTQVELNLLASKINPHFLFNTLNLMVSLLKTPERAETALINLAEILRYQLDFSDVQSVPLSSELSVVSKYLDLQKMRFGDRLTYTITGQAEGTVPPLMLQPLVENAIKHNINNVDRLQITLRLAEDNDGFQITVVDSVAAIVPAMLGKGIGLSVTQKRVEHAGGRFAIDNGGILITFKS